MGIYWKARTGGIMSEIEIIVPEGMFGPDKDYLVDAIIRAIAETYGDERNWPTKYGVNYENDVFMMKSYCWCGGDDCPWCTGEMPNFWYKPTDFKVTWYKFIGRSMEFNRPIPIGECAEILSSCLPKQEEIIKVEE